MKYSEFKILKADRRDENKPQSVAMVVDVEQR